MTPTHTAEAIENALAFNPTIGRALQSATIEYDLRLLFEGAFGVSSAEDHLIYVNPMIRSVVDLTALLLHEGHHLAYSDEKFTAQDESESMRPALEYWRTVYPNGMPNPQTEFELECNRLSADMLNGRLDGDVRQMYSRVPGYAAWRTGGLHYRGIAVTHVEGRGYSATFPGYGSIDAADFDTLRRTIDDLFDNGWSSISLARTTRWNKYSYRRPIGETIGTLLILAGSVVAVANTTDNYGLRVVAATLWFIGLLVWFGVLLGL